MSRCWFRSLSGGRVTHVLAIAPGTERPSLVTRHINYLQTIAAQCGYRLDALRREEEAIERQSREALLQQQVTEAELRALRAQINPHFLFNCLNTIADLVVRNPAARGDNDAAAGGGVPACSGSQPAGRLLRSATRSSSCEPTCILRRRGSEIGCGWRSMLPRKLEREQIPSLILQPLVENALKHGLGPKRGRGHLRIAVRAIGDQMQMTVEDDGMGPGARPSKGLGLANIAERLQTLYQDRASVSTARGARQAAASRRS